MLSLLTSLRESSASSLYNSKTLVENTTVYEAEGEFNAVARELSRIYNESVYLVAKYISSDIVIRTAQENALLKLYITFIYICFQLDNAETKLVRRFGPWRYMSTSCKQRTLE